MKTETSTDQTKDKTTEELTDKAKEILNTIKKYTDETKKNLKTSKKYTDETKNNLDTTKNLINDITNKTTHAATKELIEEATGNLDATINEINSAAIDKFFISILTIFLSGGLMVWSIAIYNQTLENNLEISKNSLLNKTFKIQEKQYYNKAKELEKLKHYCQTATDTLNREFANRIKISGTKFLGNNSKMDINYRRIEQEKREKCEDVKELETNIEVIKADIEKTIITLSNTKKGLTPVYILFFFATILLLTSTSYFLSFVKSRQLAVSVRLMTDQYHKFHLATIQCDKLENTEAEPKELINKIIEIIPKEAFSNNQKKQSELYTLLGKLKIPQRKSVEARANLIKKISEYRENA